MNQRELQGVVLAGVRVPSLGKLRRGLLGFFRLHPLGAIGAVICLFMIFVAIAAPWLSPKDPYLIDRANRLVAPGPGFLLGTDNLGRDVFSRVILGARISITVAFTAVFMAQLMGIAIGIVSGYYGGAVDQVLQRLTDIIIAIPTLIFALVLVTILEPSIRNVIFAIVFILSPGIGRVIRSQALSVKGREFITAARAIGMGDLRIMARHILPQCIAPVLVLASIEIPGAILVEASLGFLGLGVPSPTPTWGNIISESGRPYLDSAPWIALAPGIALSLTVFGFNMFGDALRDIWDPRLRGTTRA